MRFNYANYPILKKLSDGLLGEIVIDKLDEHFFTENPLRNTLYDNWEASAHLFRSEINVLSEPFAMAAHKCTRKFMTFLQDVCDNDRQDMVLSGTFIDMNLVHMLHYEVRKGSDNIEIKYFLFNKNGQPLMAYVYVDGEINFTWVSRYFGDFKEDKEFKNKMYGSLYTSVLYAMFKKYADVEVKICAANATTRGIECDYGKIKNETDQKVNFITSQWFTSIVKDESFIVRAHFRWQVCGKGFSERKLILVDAFQKNGYYRQADKLKQEAA